MEFFSENKKQPFLSIRLMTYNHGKFIEDALGGIDKQITNFDFEVVVGDDFSTDDTLQKIQNYSFQNPHLTLKILHRVKNDTYYKQRVKKGRLHNFVDILTNCKGKYIALLDGDDFWTDSLKLQKQVDFLEDNEEFSICWTRYEILKGESKSAPSWENILKNKDLYILNFNNFSSPYCTYTLTVVFKKEAFSISNYSKLKYKKDNTLYLMCLQKGKGALLSFFGGVYRLHTGGIFSAGSKYARAFSNFTNYQEILSVIPESNVRNIFNKRDFWKSEFLGELNQMPFSYLRKKIIRLKLFIYFNILVHFK